MRLLLLLIIPLAGCFGPATAVQDGPCEPADALLVHSVDGPSDEVWTVIWPDGRVWVLSVAVDATFGEFNASRVEAVEPLDIELACGIVAFHGTYPGGPRIPAWQEAGLQSRVYTYHLERTASGAADPAPVEALMDDLARLRVDSSPAGCTRDDTVRYSGMHDGRVVQREATCAWSDDFEAFHASVQQWLGSR